MDLPEPELILTALPGQPTASALLADIYARLGKREDAIGLLTEAIDKGRERHCCHIVNQESARGLRANDGSIERGQ